MGLMMGSLSIRFSHKSLYIMGFVLLSLSALGSYLSPSFIVLLVAFTLFGLSRAIIRPIGFALVGRYIPLQLRPKITSYQMVGIASAYLVGSSLVSVIGDWRLMFLVLLFPLALISGVLALKSIPSTPNDTSPSQEYRQAFKDVLFNKSALACLIAYILVNMGVNTVLATFVASFFRQTFLVDTAFISLAFMGISSIGIFGMLMGGRLVNRFGRKPVTVLSVLILGVLTISILNSGNLWASVVIWFLASFILGITMTAYSSLAMEQAPAYRATMMSLSEVSQFVAQAVGNALGGVLLLAFNYRTLSLMGIFIFLGAFIFHFLTIDPTQQAKK